MVFVYITCRDKRETSKISRYLLQKRLVACTNSFPIQSSYWWNNKIVDEKEFVLLAKTIRKNYNKIKIEVKKIHSYKIPCICLLDAEENEDYAEWVNKEIKSHFPPVCSLVV